MFGRLFVWCCSDCRFSWRVAGISGAADQARRGVCARWINGHCCADCCQGDVCAIGTTGNRGEQVRSIGGDCHGPGIKAAPDGYTLCFCTLGAMVILPMIEKVPYNPDKDLAPVIHVVNQPFVVVVRSSLNVNSLKDFVALAKSSAGKITFGSPGTATPSHLTGELLALATGTHLTHVPYKGDAPAIQDLLGGHVDADDAVGHRRPSLWSTPAELKPWQCPV
jgi:hypothetical protein